MSVRRTTAVSHHNILYFLFVLFSLFLLYPYEFTAVYLPFLPLKEYRIVFFLFLVTSLVSLVFVRKYKIEATSLIFIQAIGFSFVELSHGKFLPIFDYTLKMLMAGLLLGLVSNTIGLKEFYKKYNRWIVVMAILGCITFFLVTFKDYQPLYFIQDRADTRLIYNYILTFTKSDVLSSNDFRYAGFFDEPGAMAFWGLFALLINKLFIKDKYLEIILIPCLLVTFSMGFYVQLFVYIVLFTISKKNISKHIFALVMIFVLGIGVSMLENSKYDFIYQSTVGRAEKLLDEGSESDMSQGVGNRAEYQEKAYREFIKGPLLGTSEADSLDLGDNFFEPLAKYGVLGTLLLYSPLFAILIMSLRRKKYDVTKAVIVILIGFFHRPLHMNMLTFFIIYSMYIFTKQCVPLKNTAHD